MNAEAVSDTDPPGGSGLWAPGKVAELLDVSPITLRSWDSRYGIGPSIRPEGRHRRYSDADVRGLQHMQRLIERGVRPREAAAVVLAGSGGPGGAQLSASDIVSELADLADSLKFASMAALLDESLATRGPVGTWHEVLTPLLRGFGGRWMGGEICFEAEWALAGEISFALERYSGPPQETASGRAVLLACCPDERHSLPLEVLRAALVDRGIPVVFLRQMVPPETTVGMASRLDPAVVVLWSMSANTADEALVRRLQRRGFPVCGAGPGWEPFSELAIPRVNDLDGTLALVSDYAREGSSSAR